MILIPILAAILIVALVAALFRSGEIVQPTPSSKIDPERRCIECGQVLTAATSIDGIEHVNCDSDEVDLGRMS